LLRLDNFLVEKGFAQTRNKAQSMIKDSLVSVNGKVFTKSSYKVADGDEVVVEEHKQYVSRGAFKLSNFLEELLLDMKGLVALDIGSSTGGFTQVLLEHGVSEVTAVDVGREQLHKSLRDDKRVHSFESCDIREFESEKTFDIVVSDVAFISLLHILDDVQRLANDKIILLFKPQFEVGREAKRDSNGVVLDKKAIEKAMLKFEDACAEKGWRLIKKSPSKITGKSGNLEYCYYFDKSI
jgi:23S rRNA (cytidine1920-2'-O)/16S rRNA (cytidine1409-2'-O)-methyltransferase